MRLRADLIAAGLLLSASPALAQRAKPTPAPPPTVEPEFQEPAGEGPRGSSRVGPGEVRYDEVGYAAVGSAPGVTLVTSGLTGGFAEVTSLANGKTVVVGVVPGDAPGRLGYLSPAAAAEIGATSDAVSVRIRRVSPSPQDVSLLQQGQLAGKRADAPSALLVPLRKRLGAAPVAVAAPVGRPPAPTPARTPAKPLPVPGKPAPVVAGPLTPPPSAELRPPVQVPGKQAATPAAAKPAPVVAKQAPVVAKPVPATSNPIPNTVSRDTPSGFYVQIAALGDASRAQALAGRIGGFVEPVGNLYRVQLGPFPDGYAAERGRAAAVREGYPDARIIRVD